MQMIDIEQTRKILLQDLLYITLTQLQSLSAENSNTHTKHT